MNMKRLTAAFAVGLFLGGTAAITIRSCEVQAKPAVLAPIEHVSPNGAAFIEREEGSCRLQAYRDVTGTWTIGIGHAGLVNGKPITASTRITRATCLSLFRGDLGFCEKYVREGAHLTAYQTAFDALVSFCFNVGPAAARDAVMQVYFGDQHSAALEMLDHHWSKGKPYVCLRRRYREVKLLLEGLYVEPLAKEDVP